MDTIPKIYYNGREFDIHYKITSAAVRAELIDLISQYVDKTQKLQNKIMDLYTEMDFEAADNKEMLKKAVSEGKITIDEIISLTKSNKTDVVNNDLVTIKIFKALLNLDKYDKDTQLILAQDEYSEFWQGQDILMMENEVNSFRNRYKLTI